MITIKKFEKKYSILCILLLFISVFFNQYITYIISMIFVVTEIIKHKGKIVGVRLPGEQIYFLLLFYLSILGLGYVGFTWPFLRDFIRFSYVLLFWYVSELIIKKVSFKKEVIYNSLILFNGIYFLVEIIRRIINALQNIGGSSSEFLTLTSTGRINEFAIALTLYMLIFKPGLSSERKYFVNKNYDRIVLFLTFFAFMLSFSRTTILLFIILILFNPKKTFKILRIILPLVLIGLLISYFLPDVVDTFFSKFQRSFVEISANGGIWNSFSITNNWRGYEKYCAMEQFKKEKLFNKILGFGFGTGIDAKGYAYLVTNEDTLPYLHDGYYTMLIKGGVVGLILNLLFYALLFYKIHITKISIEAKRLGYGILFGLVISNAFINGIFFGESTLMIFLLLNLCLSKKVWNSEGSDLKPN